jgi:hypothetical protein
MWIHLVARSRSGQRPFASPDVGHWFWLRLRESFPEAIAACLMPDHVHNILDVRHPNRARTTLARLLGATSRHHTPDAHWSTAEPEVIPNVQHLRRQVRYVHLNPCRANYVTDPLAWIRSTHRGAIGAEVDPWVRADRLAPTLERSTDGFGEWFHEYVSGDPSVDPAGSCFPKPAPARVVPVVPLDSVIRAAFIAQPWSGVSAKRRLAVQFAKHQGWTDTRLIAKALRVSMQTVRQAAALRPDSAALRAAAYCLGDARLLGAAVKL